MLDRPRHVLTIGEYISGWQGGYQCSCGCGMAFNSRAAGIRHIEDVHERLGALNAYEYWDMSEETIEVVKDVDMFPIISIRVDQYDGNWYPANEETRKFLEGYFGLEEGWGHGHT